MSVTKTAQSSYSQGAQEDTKSMLSFIPAGMLRSIAEYLVALIPGAFLLFLFFIAAQASQFFIEGDIISLAFLPVICILPILAGIVSTLVLEKVRGKQLTIKRGAMVGAAAAAAGSFLSVIVLAIMQILVPENPAFGSALGGIAGLVVLPVIVAIDTVLGAVGGAILVKFVKGA